MQLERGTALPTCCGRGLAHPSQARHGAGAKSPKSPKSPPVPASPQEACPFGHAPMFTAQLDLPPTFSQQQGSPVPSTSPTVIKHTGMLAFPLKSICWVIRNSLFLKLDLQEIGFLEQTFCIWGRNRRGPSEQKSLRRRNRRALAFNSTFSGAGAARRGWRHQPLAASHLHPRMAPGSWWAARPRTTSPGTGRSSVIPGMPVSKLPPCWAPLGPNFRLLRSLLTLNIFYGAQSHVGTLEGHPAEPGWPHPSWDINTW